MGQQPSYHKEYQAQKAANERILAVMENALNAQREAEQERRKMEEELERARRPPAPPEFEDPWRSTIWEQRDQMEAELREFQLSNPEISPLRILLNGAVGAGKSSFTNSVNSVFQGRVTTKAGVDSSAGQSFTKTYKTYRIKNGSSGFLPFVFNDVMSMENATSRGVHTDDIIKALHGHVKENYKFIPGSPLSDGDQGYISDPSRSDQVHCLVSVVSADEISLMSDDIIIKMKTIREEASDLGIPQVVVMTMVDMACPLVRADLKKIYTSKKIKTKMQECSNKLGVPMNCIFPVQNYHEENTLKQDVDVLILEALTKIVNYTNDYVEDL